MEDATDSVGRLPSPDLSSLILEDYSQSLGCSPPMSSAINLDQKWVLDFEGFTADELGSHKSDHLQLAAPQEGPCTSGRDEAGANCAQGTYNVSESYMFAGFQPRSECHVAKSVNLTQDVTGEVGTGCVSVCGEAGHLVGAEANDYVIIEKESSDNVDEGSKGAASAEVRGNLVSGDAQEPQVLYTCTGALTGEETGCTTVKEEQLNEPVSTDALTGEETGCITVKEEQLGEPVSTDSDEDSEAETDSDTETSESDTAFSTSDDDIEGVDDKTKEKNIEEVESENKPNDLGKRSDCTMKDEVIHDSEVDGFELDGVNVSSDEETEKEVKGPVRTKNEPDVLPPVPPVKVVLLPHHQTLPVGVVTSIVGPRVIVDGNVKHDPLNEGSIMWITETRSPLGLVDEIFGPVKNPYYIVRYNSEEDIPLGIHVGTSVCFVAEYSTNILNQSELYKKGYDASGENDEEMEEEVEFSDDEKEAEYRKSLRQYKRGKDGQNYGAGDEKQMHPEVNRKAKKFTPASTVSVQQRLPHLTCNSNVVSSEQPSNNYFGSGSTRVPPVSSAQHSHGSLGIENNLGSSLRSPWKPSPSTPLQNVVSGNSMTNGALAQAGNPVMQGVTMNAHASQPMLTAHMQNVGLSGGLFMNTNPFQNQAQLGNASNILFQNQQQTLQQFQQQQQLFQQQQFQQQQQLFQQRLQLQQQLLQPQQLQQQLLQSQQLQPQQLQQQFLQQLLQPQSMSPFSYTFPTQPHFAPYQAPNVFPLNGRMNPSPGSMCFEPALQNNSLQVPYNHHNTSVAATNMNNRGQADRNHLPSSNNGNVLPRTQFHFGDIFSSW